MRRPMMKHKARALGPKGSAARTKRTTEGNRDHLGSGKMRRREKRLEGKSL